MKKIFILLFSLNSLATFLPKNDLRIFSENKSLTKERAQKIINEFYELYKDEVTTKGGELRIDLEWDNPSVNAYAARDGNLWKVRMLGGLAKHGKMTDFIFSTILCHELGHHLGGAPFKTKGNHEHKWVSVEGQADYYATNICMKKYFLSKREIQKKNPKKFIKKHCDSHHSLDLDRSFCYFHAEGAIEVAKFVRNMGGRRGRRSAVPSITKPSSKVVTSVFEQHPDVQCRLDTLFAGTLCPRFFEQEEQPNCLELGKKSARPRCWFVSKD